MIILSKTVNSILDDIENNDQEDIYDDSDREKLLDIAMSIINFMPEFVNYMNYLYRFQNKVINYKIALDALHYKKEHGIYKTNQKSYSILKSRIVKSERVYKTLENTYNHIQSLMGESRADLPKPEKGMSRKINKMMYYDDGKTADLAENIKFVANEVQSIPLPTELHAAYESIMMKLENL